MFKTFCAIIAIFWAFDVVNMPFMEIFDTTYPINSLAWFIVLFVVSIVYGAVDEPTIYDKPTINIVSGKEKEETDDNHEE